MTARKELDQPGLNSRRDLEESLNKFELRFLGGILLGL